MTCHFARRLCIAFLFLWYCRQLSFLLSAAMYSDLYLNSVALRNSRDISGLSALYPVQDEGMQIFFPPQFLITCMIVS